jgi:hypothetical protein
MAKPGRISEIGGGSGMSRGVKSVKVSSNVTVKAVKGKTISAKEAARLKNINAPKKTTKGSAKALKVSGKPAKGKKANTMYTQNDFVDGKFVQTKGTARKFAQDKSKTRVVERSRAGFSK